MNLTQNQKLLNKIINKAWEDAEFKKQLMTNPLEAIETAIGQKLVIPEGKKIIVKDQTSEKVIYINIPVGEKDNVELNEEELELVSGGVHGDGCTGPSSIDIKKLITTLPTFPTDY